jgi:hypothetical protein
MYAVKLFVFVSKNVTSLGSTSTYTNSLMGNHFRVPETLDMEDYKRLETLIVGNHQFSWEKGKVQH